MVQYASPAYRQAGFQAWSDMIYIYAIYDHVCREIYVGMTNNLDRRIKEHKRGQSKYTRKFKNIEVFYLEKFDDYKTARKQEKYFKSGSGKEFLKSLLNKRV